MIEIVLYGVDGSRWDLRRGTQGVKLSDQGISGFGTNLYDAVVSTSARQAGQRLDRTNVLPRSVVLPVRLRSSDVEGVQRAWWRALNIDHPNGPYVRLEVTDRQLGVRELFMRLDSDGGRPLTGDPDGAESLNTVHPITFIADDPFWLGPEVVSSYSSSDSFQPQFFGDGAGAPPFNIIDSGGIGGSYVLNPGDIPAYPTIEAEGEISDGFYVFVSGRLIQASSLLVVPAGQTLILETDPTLQYAELDGQPVLRMFNTLDFYPIPAAGGANVTIGVTGDGRVRVLFRPRYRRAY